MHVQDVEDAADCPYFPTNLKGVAQSWFNGVPPGVLRVFWTWRISLLANSSLKERRTSIDLLRIKHGPQESLAEFVKCFH